MPQLNATVDAVTTAVRKRSALPATPGASNFIDFLSLPNVVCADGSWVCPPDAIQNHDWDRISQLAQDVQRAIEQIE